MNCEGIYAIINDHQTFHGQARHLYSVHDCISNLSPAACTGFACATLSTRMACMRGCRVAVCGSTLTIDIQDAQTIGGSPS